MHVSVTTGERRCKYECIYSLQLNSTTRSLFCTRSPTVLSRTTSIFNLTIHLPTYHRRSSSFSRPDSIYSLYYSLSAFIVQSHTALRRVHHKSSSTRPNYIRHRTSTTLSRSTLALRRSDHHSSSRHTPVYILLEEELRKTNTINSSLLYPCPHCSTTSGII